MSATTDTAMSRFARAVDEVKDLADALAESASMISDATKALTLAQADVEAEVSDLERERDRYRDEAMASESEVVEADARAERAERLALDLVRHLHEVLRHRGPWSWCQHEVCDQGTLFLALEGVEVR